MKPIQASSLLLAITGLLLGTAPQAAAFPATKDTATLSLTFNLLPTATGSGTSSGTVSLDVTRSAGVSTSSALTISLTGVADGSYTVAAKLKSDGGAVPVTIGSITVPIDPVATPLSLPTGLDALDIASIGISDATSEILSGPATETITSWNYMGNQPIKVPTVTAPPPGHGPKPKTIKGHLLIQNKFVDGVEKKRKFLLVGQRATPGTTYTINLDGVAVGTVTATKTGKLMAKSLEGDFRLAGTHLVTLTTTDGTTTTVAAQVDFYPSLP
jgi:hypothetical protein